MYYILRENYLNQINQFKDKPIVKILTGMRRVGKSTILKMVSNILLSSIPDENKIFLNFESFNLLKVRNAENLAEYIQMIMSGKEGKLYFFFDEIQLVSGWESVINGLQVEYDCDIYLTGLNSSMLSGDLSTLLAGRYVNFEVLPFTFKEFCVAHEKYSFSTTELFNQFLVIGGMPFLHYLDFN